MKTTQICIIFALFGLGVVGTAAIANRARVEGDRIHECRELLRESGHSDVQIVIRGSHCIVKGSVASEPDKAKIEEMLRDLDGIGEMNTHDLLVAGP